MFTIPAPALRDLLVGTVLAASRDFTLPVLTTVLLTWESRSRGDGESAAVLVATATDRYRMNEGRCPILAPASGRALVDRRDVEALVKTLPKLSAHPGATKCGLDPRER